MASLVWDQVGSRVFENGLDKGVLYLPDGSGVSWSGLTEIQEKFEQKVEPVYFDGRKISDLVTLGTFTASLKAITYPDEFLDLEGVASLRLGLYLADQNLRTFGLCYRTQIGNDVEQSAGYKLHILYNLTAVPTDSSYTSLSDDPELVEFEWEITSIPNDATGFRPTAHMIVDSRTVDPWLLADIEDILYGGSDGDATLLPIDDLIEYLNEWFRLSIVYHGDGTWSAIEYKDGTNIRFGEDGWFEIFDCNAVYLDEVTFKITDTMDITDIPTIDINDNGNGTWSATSSHDVLIEVEGDMFTINDANAVYLDEYTYEISDSYTDAPAGVVQAPNLRKTLEED